MTAFRYYEAEIERYQKNIVFTLELPNYSRCVPIAVAVFVLNLITINWMMSINNRPRMRSVKAPQACFDQPVRSCWDGLHSYRVYPVAFSCSVLNSSKSHANKRQESPHPSRGKPFTALISSPIGADAASDERTEWNKEHFLSSGESARVGRINTVILILADPWNGLW